MLQHFSSSKIICGIDEAGRGCIAGPVVAAAVILPKNFSHDFLNDSKQLSEKQRNELRPLIEKKAIAFGVGIIDNHTVDEVNILQATYLAMHQAIEQVKQKIDLLIIDGNRFKSYKKIPHQTIIKGDGKYIEIAAASILAKTYRDEIMENLSLEFPIYQWQKNKGYPTIAHRAVIKENGSCIYHRQTFRLLKEEQLRLF
ncbi:MAG TPA: ribonuclease HII [Chitinophagales bacterium]|jgi:ribonuclease HII|nr:ribonuclease HII [Chitinophagales bacterium]MBP6154795.1 ribonuclease HII [Chitinophagales bacterium]HQV76859.1 ribonuclease HII [Chitinophagales bacterium]HQW78074.1 ribonuclease HII [Chitinophagales bacterium]HRB67831.1 ribonuclease HII [Chitinophagales bacterium]